MKYGDQEYQRRLEIIRSIPPDISPSNKFDDVDLSRYSEQEMRDFEIRNLQELTQWALNQKRQDQMALAMGLDIAVLYEALGMQLQNALDKLNKFSEINNG